MKHAFKLSVLLLAFVVLLSGCGKSPLGGNSSNNALTQEKENGTRDYLTLLYSAADSFNPYTAATDMNKQLLRLVFDPLVKLDNEYNPTFCVAENAGLNGQTCTVTLKNLLFSDGTAVTAADVVYSFNLAKSSATEYGYKLYRALSATADGDRTVVFKLSSADPYFLNLLDFPIIKRESELKTDSDSVALPPIGCGRFVPNESRNRLELNPNYSQQGFAVKEIRLINAPDAEAVSHYAEIGAADIYYSDISDGNIIRMSGKKLNININHIVYLGVNQADSRLAVPELRQAISSAIDRSAVCRDSYYNNAVAATGFYNPVWSEVSAVQNIEKTANKEITVEILEKLGYNRVDSNGKRMASNGARLRFSLLVNTENRIRVSVARLISEKLSEVGFEITVVEKSVQDYTAALAAGNFELYLAEVALTPNMDLSSLVTEGGSVAYGIKAPQENYGTEGVEQNTKTPSEIVAGIYTGVNTVTDAETVLQSEMPFIPICYRTGVLFYNDNIENITGSSASDIYFSIDSYKFK